MMTHFSSFWVKWITTADHTSVFSMSIDFLLQCTNTDFHEQKFKQFLSGNRKRTIGFKQGQQSWMIPVHPALSPRRCLSGVWSSQRMWCEFKDDLMICADMGGTCRCRDCALRFTYTRWGCSYWTVRVIISHSAHWPHPHDLAHKLTCKPQTSIWSIHCGCGGSLWVHF